MFKKLRVMTPVAAVLLTFSCGRGPDDQIARNKEVVRQFAAAINARELDRLDEFVHPDVVRHSDATAGLKVESLEQFKTFLKADFEACPDSVQTIHTILAEGDLVAMVASYAGTQSGQMGPFPPSDVKAETRFIGVARMRDGKIAELWVEWDNLNLLTQWGHINPGDPFADAATNQSDQ